MNIFTFLHRKQAIKAIASSYLAIVIPFVIFIILLLSPTIINSFEIRKESRPLNRSNANTFLEEKSGVFIRQGSEWEIYPDSIEVGDYGLVATTTIENWTNDLMWVERLSFKYTGSYPIEKFDSIFTVQAPNEQTFIHGDTIDFIDSTFSIQPWSEVYIWTIGFFPKNDTTTGYTEFEIPNEKFINNINWMIMQPLAVQAEYPVKLKKFWIVNTTLDIESKQGIDETFNISPNPASEHIDITLKLQKPNLYSISIYDCLGNRIADVINNKYLTAGEHKIEFDSSDLSAGVYFCFLRYGDKVETMKMIVVK